MAADVFLTIYEAILVGDWKDSVGSGEGGGRYDGLVGMFGPQGTICALCGGQYWNRATVLHYGG